LIRIYFFWLHSLVLILTLIGTDLIKRLLNFIILVSLVIWIIIIICSKYSISRLSMLKLRMRRQISSNLYTTIMSISNGLSFDCCNINTCIFLLNCVKVFILSYRLAIWHLYSVSKLNTRLDKIFTFFSNLFVFFFQWTAYFIKILTFLLPDCSHGLVTAFKHFKFQLSRIKELLFNLSNFKVLILTHCVVPLLEVFDHVFLIINFSRRTVQDSQYFLSINWSIDVLLLNFVFEFT